MTLRSCRECGSQVSTTAITCPYCGIPRPAMPAAKQPLSQRDGRRGIVILVAIFILMGSAAIFAALAPQSVKTTLAPPTSPVPTVPEAGQKWQMKIAAPACRAENLLDKLIAFAKAKDNEAYENQWLMSLGAGQCRLLDQGRHVFIETAGAFSFPCVRPRGETVCWYTLDNAIEPLPQ